jgi:O-antigen/teichoic acid export membrane protein
MERFSAKIVTFIVSLVLARLLDPTTYGTVALVTVFTTILEVFVDSGLGNALIQKKDADSLDFSSVFYFNMAMCSALYVGMFFAAPAIAGFYDSPELVPIVRVMSLTLIISGAKNILQAYVSRRMQFKKFFFVNILGTCVSAIVGLTMAFMGYGVWALVAQPLVNYGINTVALWITVDWRPKREFSFQRLKGLLSYGWKILVAKLLNVTYTKSRDLIIGKIYSPADLAFFNKGDTFPAMIVPNITTSIDGVTFPVMAKEQDNKERIRELVKKSTQISSYIVMPMMAGLIACATPLVRVLMTEKWLPCVPYLYMFCLVYAFWPVSIANLNSMRSLGHSETVLKVEIIEKVFSVALLLITIRMGVFWIGISYMVGELFSAIMCTIPNKKLISYGFARQFLDLLPLIIVSTITGTVTYLIQLIGLPDILTLIIQVPLGVIVYLFLSWIFKLYGFAYFIDLLKRNISLRKEWKSNFFT